MSLFEDTYRTLSTHSEGSYREKGSKFLAFAFPVENEETVKEKLAEIKKSYHDARHCCYAYILGADKAAYRINDDGEPSGTAGRPIYGQLLANDLTNTLVIVIRYFGGVKLGVSGLINAYKTAAKEALEANQIIEKTVDETYKIAFDYPDMNRVMQILKDDAVSINGQFYEERNSITFTIRRREADRIINALRKIPGLTVEFMQ